MYGFKGACYRMEQARQEILKELEGESLIFLEFVLSFIKRCKNKKRGF